MDCRTIIVTPAEAGDTTEIADVAARTFPLACPPSVSAENVAAFIDANLSVARFTEYLADADRAVLIAREAGASPILGYAMLIRGVPEDPDVQRAVSRRPAVELSKIYVLPHAHGGTVSAALMNAALEYAAGQGAACLWLGVNQKNARAQRFYAKNGFTVAGTKSFRLGTRIESDYVMTRLLAETR